MGDRASHSLGRARFQAARRGGGQVARPHPVRNSWFVIRELVGSNRLTFPLLRLAPGRRAIASPDSDVCIGGYIRSGNTYAFHAFARWNPDARIAHHVHLTEQVARAVRLGVPCAVLVRPPLDAVTSLVIFEEGRLADGVALRGYLRYHRAILRLRDGIVLCGFDELLEDPATLVRRLNERYGTAFHHEPMDEAGRRELLATIERFHVHRDRRVATFSVPAAEKEQRKPEVRDRLAGHPLMAEARDLYARLTGAAG